MIREEKVYGGDGVRFLYQTKPGYILERALLSRKPLSHLYGLYNDSSFSRARIESFIEAFEIPVSQYEVPPNGFSSFNDFFIRKFRPGMRSYPKEPARLGAPAEARYLITEKITASAYLPASVKGDTKLSLKRLLGERKDLFSLFSGGTLVVARLCPVDYHRFHFFDDGEVIQSQRIEGALHSVNPIAMVKRPTIFEDNEREMTLLQTKSFGKVLYIEVGALCVGRIHQSYRKKNSRHFSRGQEKGYFTFGASTVLLLFAPGALTVDSDVLEHSQKGMEVFLKLGEAFGTAAPK